MVTIPSKKPSDSTDMASALGMVMRKQLMQVDGMLPATVVSYNRRTNRATVTPSINMITTSGQSIGRPSLANIKVLALGGGGWLLTFPLKAGDTGWIEASDRDISGWLQRGSGAASNPNTHRIHSFSDGRFIPDVLANATPVDDTAVCLQNESGSVALTIGDNGVVITGGLTVDGIVFGSHTHGGVQSGGSNTSGPQ